MKRLFWLVPAILILILAGCAQPPKAEVDAAEAAVARAAKSPDVVAYAPNELRRAQDSLAEMRTELAAKRYDKTKTLALAATDAAEAAIAAAPVNKDRAKVRASELIEAVKKAIPEAEALLKSTARLPKGTIDLAAKAIAIAEAKASLDAAEAAFAAGDYLKAIEKASAAQKTLSDLTSEISAAVQTTTRKK